MAYPHSFVEDALWEWSAFLLLFFRSLAVCVVAFASVNANVFIRASIQVQPVRKGTTSSGGRTRRKTPNAGSEANGCDADARVASDQRRHARRHPSDTPPPDPSSPTQQYQNHFQRPLAPRPTKFPSPPNKPPTYQHPAPPPSLASVYEDIISADEETIRVQQATILSQQEIIGAQRDMIEKLRGLVEAQDAWIEGCLEGEGR